jgi:hypothetical protein
MQAMLTVKKYTRGPGGIPVGKPAIHPATVDLRGKAYESVFISFFFHLFSVFVVLLLFVGQVHIVVKYRLQSCHLDIILKWSDYR